MIILIFFAIFTLVLGLYLTIAIAYDSYSRLKCLATTIVLFLFIIFILNPIANEMAYNRENHIISVNDYHIPLCPDAGIKHWEQHNGVFDNETQIIDQFKEHGWINITSSSRTEGGFFGGHYNFIYGDCKL